MMALVRYENSLSLEKVSVPSGMSYHDCCFRLWDGSIVSPHIIEFVKILKAAIEKKRRFAWVRRQACQSRHVHPHDVAQQRKGAISDLTAYPLKLNLAKWIFEYLEHYAVPNYRACEIDNLARLAHSNPSRVLHHTNPVQALRKHIDRFRRCSEVANNSIVALLYTR